MQEENDNTNIVISGITIAPGDSKLVEITIGRLPTGTWINIPVHVFNAKNPGPTLLVQAGLHGDEINGIETLRRMLHQDSFKVERGAVIVVPILNIYGFIHFSRDVPDGKDVNRSFPGYKNGSLASRIAYHYTQEIAPQIDIAIDLHTGGGQRHNFPQVRYTASDEHSKKLAEIFGAPFYFASNLIAKSFRKTAFKLGKPTIVFEGGESMRFDENSIAIAIDGITNILLHLGMVEGHFTRKSSEHFSETKWIRSPRAGMFVPQIDNGNYVEKGQIIGLITDAYTKKNKKLKSPQQGYIFCVNHQAVVNQGDALFNLGIL